MSVSGRATLPPLPLARYNQEWCTPRRGSQVLFNVSQLLREPIGSERTYTLDAEITIPDADVPPTRVHGRVRLVRTNHGLIAYTDVEATIDDVCSRCLAPVQIPLRLHGEDEFFPSVDPVTGAPLPDPDDPFAFRIDAHHHLDLTDVVVQLLVLERPMQPRCRETCAGLCADCGANLNDEPEHRPHEATDARWAILERIRNDV